MSYSETKTVWINNRYELLLPEFRSQSFPWEHWEQERMHAMYCAIRKSDYILDIGTEMGDMSALFSKWCDGKIILAEPADNYWPHIKSIFEMNNLKEPIASITHFVSEQSSDNIKIYTGFPPQSDEKLTFEGDEGFGFRHLNEQVEDIGSITIDDISEIYPIDVITMDIEGAEYNALMGAEKTLRDKRPIVFISIHPEFIRERYGMTKDDVIVHMKKMNYETTYLGRDHEDHFMFKPL